MILGEFLMEKFDQRSQKLKEDRTWQYLAESVLLICVT